MNALLTARLAAWREIHARWPLFLLGPVLIVFAALIEEEVGDALEMFVFFVLLPPFTMYLAARPGAKADPFWRGLGGPRWASLAGTVAIHAAVLGVTALASAPGAGNFEFVDSELGRRVVLGEALVFGLLYVTTAAARSFLAGGAVASGALLAASALTLGGWLNLHVWRWSPELAFVVRAGLIFAAAIVLMVWGEARYGAWGGAVRRRRWAISATVAGVVLLLPVALDAADVGGFWTKSLRLDQVSEDGTSAAYSQDARRFWFSGAGRAGLWTEADGLQSVGPAGGEYPWTGPHGAIAVSRYGDRGDPVGTWTWLRTASGVEVRCDGVSPAAWRPDGEAIAVRRIVPQGTVADPDVPARAILSPAGCAPNADDVERVAWDHGRLVELTDEGRLRIGGTLQELPAALGRPQLSQAGEYVVVSRLAYRKRGPKRGEVVATPGVVGLVVGDDVRVLVEGPDLGHDLWTPDDRLCVRVGDEHRCWTLDDDLVETRTSVPDGAIPTAGGTLAWRDGRLHDSATARSWAIPEPEWWRPTDRSYWPMGFPWRVRVVGDHVRVFDQRRVDEVDQAGTVTTLASW